MLPLIELDWEILEQTPIHVKVVKEFGPGSNPISDIIEIFQFFVVFVRILVKISRKNIACLMRECVGSVLVVAKVVWHLSVLQRRPCVGSLCDLC